MWNELNQLVRFTDKYHTQWYYRYDGLGRRIEKRCPAQQWCVKYHWDGDQLAYTQTFKQGKAIAQRHSVFRGWELVAQQDNVSQNREPLFQTHFVVSEPNGKVQGLFTPEGELAWQAEPQSLWGIYLKVVHHHRPIHPLDPQMLFAGQWRDSESGLAYNRFRYYDPESGNYLSLGPIGLQGGEMPYRYVGNPLDWVDFLGLVTCGNRMPSWMPPKNGYQRHHIVPYSFRNHPAFRRSELNINSAQNMIYLPNKKGIDPTKSIHNGWSKAHRRYNEKIGAMLGKAEKERWDKLRILSEIRNIRESLRLGKIGNLI